MKATEQYFPAVLVIMMLALTFEVLGEILKCDHSNESYWAILLIGAVYDAVQGGTNFRVCTDVNMTAIVWALRFRDALYDAKKWPHKWKLLSRTFMWCCNIFLKGSKKGVVISFHSHFTKFTRQVHTERQFTCYIHF